MGKQEIEAEAHKMEASRRVNRAEGEGQILSLNEWVGGFYSST